MQVAGDGAQAFIRHPAAVSLDDFQGVDGDRRARTCAISHRFRRSLRRSACLSSEAGLLPSYSIARHHRSTSADEIDAGDDRDQIRNHQAPADQGYLLQRREEGVRMRVR